MRDGKTGYLCDEGDADTLADNLRKMLSDPNATAQMGQAGRERALEDFNLQKQSRKLEEHLLRIAGH